jgi:hypothetical protein
MVILNFTLHYFIADQKTKNILNVYDLNTVRDKKNWIFLSELEDIYRL